MTDQGFTAPTPVQRALLVPGLETRDLLVSAQTGSGKTVAFGLMIARALLASQPVAPTEPSRACRPRALVIAPTRELAVQVRTELSWLLAPVGLRVLAVTGGTSVGGELRALQAGAEVVVGTPGRLVDHITRGSLDGATLEAVVLDEADEMLDMGFREELEAILAALPSTRKTWMFSATLPPEITSLAKKYQHSPTRIAADPPGVSNANIQHVCHVVADGSRVDALVNLLLSDPDERMLVFVRTRIEASELAASLLESGFNAAALTGEMAQKDRTNTLDSFRSGRVTVLVATDVAARGLDVPEVGKVVHYDLPGDASVLTHRSGRTGRAGRKGVSVMLVGPGARRRAHSLLLGAGVKAQWERVPGLSDIRKEAENRLRARLTVEREVEPRHAELATALLAQTDVHALVARLLGEVRWEGPCAPREVAHFDLREPREAQRPYGDRSYANDRPYNHDRPSGDRSFGDRPKRSAEGYEMFRVNFGERHGATAGRLLAMLCRRGGVKGADIGSIRLGSENSTFGVATEVARDFARAASRPDKIDVHIHIEPMAFGAAPAAPAARTYKPRNRYA